MLSQIAKASLRSEILVDFNCYVDTEFGLIKLIKDKYLDKDIFNLEKLNQSNQSIILSLIDRKEINPLYLFANDNISKKDLDDYYREFMTEEYVNVLKRSVLTNLNTLFDLFKSESGIHVTFLCDSPIEKEYLKVKANIDESDIVLYKQENIDFAQYTTYYFKFVTDQVNEYLFPYKTYYFSKYKLNFSEDHDIIRPDIINKIMYKHGEVEIIDLYNKSLLKGVQENARES